VAAASEEWAIEHVQEQQYDVFSLLDYDASDVEMSGPNVKDTNIEWDPKPQPWRRTFDALEPNAPIRLTLTPQLQGQPSKFCLQISWTDPGGERHSGSYTIPQPGRTRPDLRSPVPPGLATRAANTPTRVGRQPYARPVPEVDPRDVFVVVGRNRAANASMFAFLRAINLNPMEWTFAVAATGSGAPYIGDALEAAFAKAKAVVVFMTPDDIAQLRDEYANGPNDPELKPTPQARPNVLFEAGMALGLHPNRTILVELGELRSFSDVAGRHTVRIDNSAPKRNDLATRLRNAGCAVVTTGNDWYEAGDFTPPKAPGGPRGRRLPSSTAPKPRNHLDARFLHRSSGSDRIQLINVGSEDVLELTSPNAKDFNGRIDGFPVPRLPAGKSINLTVIQVWGSPRTFDLVAQGHTESGEEFSESLFLDLNG
jgi:predicted nucleotide-binding protein